MLQFQGTVETRANSGTARHAVAAIESSGQKLFY
jgi:hypothetical protein